ncbi:MAG: urease accessory protein UreD [Rubrivivax sp.]
MLLGSGWRAHLELRALRNGAATRLHSAHEGPLRLLKTLHPEGPGIAHAVLVHPPGGLVGGDRLDIDIDVQPGAHMLVTTPAATRFYRSIAGEAVQAVRATVAAGARLEWLPQETLAYDGCEGRNAWQVRLAPGASLMALEVLALGLAESQRPFARGRFVQSFGIEGLWRERGVIDAADRALLDGPCGLAGRSVLGTLLLAHGEAIDAAAAQAALDAAREIASEAAPEAAGEAARDLASDAAPSCGVTGLVRGARFACRRHICCTAACSLVRVLAHEVEPAMCSLHARVA